ncbi:MAG: hypothetical protein GTO45_21505 [Candidatus Aminicenantes bacterium]|nr:hypothetical protein [Candidatus Aminicenantes bacterium]NIM81333.1 hypothetical protein [Candidatus Aminicenantes bacterium]NIN20743.1 hypothetical protein [Candidatus Aminicenantes bacterium]NIN44521.1 hypothetical protein [Candidatus Aminicenantes bacterium]NIN87341.1 hypothetical protein [Candidatus Aminicenantes bacterium]
MKRASLFCVFFTWILVLFLRGEGIFIDSGQNLGTSSSECVALGDLDGDGDLDAFVANVYYEPNKVWLNDGKGTFIDSGQNLEPNSRSYGVALGDLDGDGDLDAFVANHDQHNKVWLNNGNGIFTNSGQNLGKSCSSEVALADLDGDGDLDAFVANGFNQPNKVWLNNGNGIFTDSGQNLGNLRSTFVALGDLDGDGDLDAFVTNHSQPDKVWLNNGNGIFTDSGQNLGNSISFGVALGDIDSYGDLDAFIAILSDFDKVFWNDGNGIFTDSSQNLGILTLTEGIAHGDLDSDGDLDVFVSTVNQQANRVWLNDGNGIFWDSGQTLGNSYSPDVALGDLDGDGDLDAFVANLGQPNKVWLNQAHTVSGRITYGGTGLSGVTLTFSNNGGTTTTDQNGYYSHVVLDDWLGTVTPSKSGYTFTPSSRNYTPITVHQTDQDYTVGLTIPTQISLSRTQLNFGAYTDGIQTDPQSFLITNSGIGTLNWTVSDNANWLNCAPTSGTGSALVTVSISPLGLSPGTYLGTITVEDPNAVNSPQRVNVTLIVYDTGSANPPFGSFDTPGEGSTVTGSIAVTGWVIDNIGIESVTIYRDPVPGEGSGLIYIWHATLVEGARPDVELLYPGYPYNYKAGWGYMMLTNVLPNQGNGTFTIYAKATDKEGNTVTLGTKTIECDNANAVKPFGAIDTPEQGGIASGSSFVNFGWALTPLPNTIPTDGSTITVWVDGTPLGNVVYNQYRKDVADLFPEYNNSDGAGGYYYLDTTQYENGVHTIAWSVIDDAGNQDGIGSRYFTIQNTGSDGKLSLVNDYWLSGNKMLSEIPVDYFTPVKIKKGYNENIKPQIISPGDNGIISIEIKELQRLEVQLDKQDEVEVKGYLVLGKTSKPLPIGSTLDPVRGVFSWQPGPGFIGNYEFVFIEKTGAGDIRKKIIIVKINPKFAWK